MHKSIHRALLTLLMALSLGSTAARAAEYKEIDPAQSQIGFTYAQMGVSMDGRFAKFGGTLSFNPAKPEAAKASLDVQLASIDAGSPDANGEVAGKAWFDTAHFPVAHFEATSIKSLGGNRYQISGKLGIKGRTRDISAAATLTPQGKQALVEGTFEFNRNDFAIGEGSWSDTSVVANPIRIKFKLVIR